MALSTRLLRVTPRKGSRTDEYQGVFVIIPSPYKCWRTLPEHAARNLPLFAATNTGTPLNAACLPTLACANAASFARLGSRRGDAARAQ